MNTDKLSGIVVYTIHDNDLRNEFHNALIKIGAEFLDQSTYGIAIQGENRKEVVKQLKDICTIDETKWNKEDFVRLYWPTFKEETDDDRFIKQTIIH